MSGVSSNVATKVVCDLLKGKMSTDAVSAGQNAVSDGKDSKTVGKAVKTAAEAKKAQSANRVKLNETLTGLISGCTAKTTEATPKATEGAGKLQQSGGLVGVDITAEASDTPGKTGSNATNINVGLGSTPTATSAVDTFNGTSATGDAATISSITDASSANVGQTTAGTSLGTAFGGLILGSGVQNSTETSAPQIGPTIANAQALKKQNFSEDASANTLGYTTDWFDRKHSWEQEEVQQTAASKGEEAPIESQEKADSGDAAQTVTNKNDTEDSSDSTKKTDDAKEVNDEIKTGKKDNNEEKTNSTDSSSLKNILESTQKDSIANDVEDKDKKDELEEIKEEVKAGDKTTKSDLDKIKDKKSDVDRKKANIAKDKNTATNLVNSGDNNFKKFESEADASQTLFSTAAATEGTAAGLYAAAEAAKASVVGSGAAAGLEAAAHAASAAAFAQNQTAQAKGQSAANTGTEALTNYGSATDTLASTESKNANPLTGLATEIASLSETVKKDNTALYSRVESKVGQLKNGKSSNNTSGFATSSIASNAANNNGNKKFGSLTTQSFNV